MKTRSSLEEWAKTQLDYDYHKPSNAGKLFEIEQNFMISAIKDLYNEETREKPY